MKKSVEDLRKEYPVGCRIVLDQMDDAMAPSPGTQGTVLAVDDTGSVIPAWDTGGRLSILNGVDRCHRIRTEEEARVTLDWYGKHQKKDNARCPRCGCMMDGPTARQALSTWADIGVCTDCGIAEAFERMKPEIRKPLMHWAAVKGPQEGEGLWE